jgi:hypothetical protein
VVAALVVLGSRTQAFAQVQSAMVGTPGGDIGIKVSETSVLHVGVAAEAGYDTNVFYNDQQATSSAILQVIPSFMVTNNGRDGNPRSAVVYTLGANLTYREYLNDNEDVRAQRAFVPRAVASLSINGEKTRLTMGDSFSRTEEAPYFPGGETIKRDNNQGGIGVGVSPGGGRLTFSLRYSNALDYFEGGNTSAYTYASNMTHDGMFDVSWKWLPKTALFLQAGGAYIHFLNPGTMGLQQRDDSTQVRGLLGLRGLVTPKTTVNLSLGYMTAFYPAGSASPSGVSNINGLLDVGYMPTLLSRLNLTLQHTFRNSPVIGDYYDLDSASLAASHMLGRLVGAANLSFEYRRYHNYANPVTGDPIDRKDSLLGAGVSFDYFIQRWFFAGVTYRLGLARPSSNDPAAVPYTKHQVLARLGLAY